MPDYKLGKIYKIISDLSDECYIGSTTAPRLCTRMSGHRSDYNRWLNNNKNYLTIFKLFFENNMNTCKIILLEKWPCSSKEQLEARETYWIKKTLNCVNKINPYLSKEEKMIKYYNHYKIYNETHKKNRKNRKQKNYNYLKEYRKKNKDILNAKRREYRRRLKELIE